MADLDIQTANVKVPNNDLEVAAYLAYLTTEGVYPVIYWFTSLIRL